MKRIIKDSIKRSFVLYGAYLFYSDRLLTRTWKRNGCPLPPPPLVKQRYVLQYQRRYNLGILVETGTYHGEMVRAARRAFHKIYSIELSPELHRRARETFASLPHIHLLQGDSARVLGQVLVRIDQPCLFWLDAHYSGTGTSLGDRETPILAELAEIMNHPSRWHVILIDDARLCDGTRGYPTLDNLSAFVKAHRPEWCITIANDIIRITPGVPIE